MANYQGFIENLLCVGNYAYPIEGFKWLKCNLCRKTSKYSGTTNIFGASPGGSVRKNPPTNTEDVGSIPESRRSPREGNGNPFQNSCWEFPRTEEIGRLQFLWSQKSQA